MTFAEKITRLTARRNMTKTELGARVGLTPRALNNYFRGKRIPQDKYLERIAAVLGIEPSELTDSSTSIPPSGEEEFIKNAVSSREEIKRAEVCLLAVREILTSEKFAADDKRAFFACLTELYINSINNG